MQPNLSIGEGQLRTIKAVLARHLPSDIRVYAFGSRVHGRNIKTFSDFDLCLKGRKPIPDQTFFSLRDALDESNLAIKVDLVDWHKLTPDFQDAIVRDFVLLV